MEKYKNLLVIPYKLELLDVKLYVLLTELPWILQQLRGGEFFLMDLDITQDFVGVF